MTYEKLKYFFCRFHMDDLTKKELICAIGLWQESLLYSYTSFCYAVINKRAIALRIPVKILTGDY